MMGSPLKHIEPKDAVVYTPNGVRYRLLVTRKRKDGRTVWTIEGGQLCSVAILLCDSAYYRRTRHGRKIEAEYKAATLQTLDRQLNPNTSEFRVYAYLSGEPTDLRWRRFLFGTGQLFPIPNRREYSKHKLHIRNVVHESMNEARERLAAHKGVDSVQKTFQPIQGR